MGYEVLEHTADLRLRVWGRDEEELFREALLAMAEIMKAERRRAEHEEKNVRNVHIQSQDITTLLVDFLNEILTLAQTHREIYTEIFFKRISEAELIAELSGFAVEGFEEDIKAVTYHEAEIRKNVEGNLETNLVFDI